MDNSLPPQKIASFLSSEANSTKAGESWKPIESSYLEALRTRSAARVAANSKFQEILKDAEEARKANGLIKLAEVRRKSTEEKAKNKKNEKKSFADRLKDAEAPYVNEGLAVLADLVTAQRGGTQALPQLTLALTKPAKASDAKKSTNSQGTAALTGEN